MIWKVDIMRINGKQLGLFLGPSLFLLLLLIPPLPYTDIVASRIDLPFDKAPQYALGVLLWMAVWWISECVPLGLTGLIAPLMLSIAGILAWKSALMVFMHPIIWIFMAGFILAKCFSKWGLDKRLALSLASIYKGSNPMLATFFVACLPVFVLTTTGSITASTSIVYPLLLAYLKTLNLSEKSRYAEASMIALGQAATAGAMLLLISTPPNLVAKIVLESMGEQYSVNFFDWFIVGTPHAILGLLISWLVTFYVVKPEMKTIEKLKERVELEKKKLGSMSAGEKLTLVAFVMVLILWMIPGFLAIASSIRPELSSIYGYIKQALPEAAPVVILMIYVCLIKVKGEPILEWNELLRGIDWNVVFLFGGGIALGSGLDKSGFSSWLVEIVTQNVPFISDVWTLTLITSVIGFLITYPASNTASAWIACPIAVTLARSAGINPIIPVIATALACSISSALPSTTPPMAIVYSSGYIRMWNMFKVGMISDTIRFIILIALEPMLASMLCGMKGFPVYI